MSELNIEPNQEALSINVNTVSTSPDLTKQTTKVTTRSILAWIFSILLFIAGVGNLVIKPFVGIFEILAGLSIFPPYWQMAKNKFGYELKRRYRVGIFLLLLIISGSAYGYGQSAKQTNSSSTSVKAVAQNTIAPTIHPTFSPEPSPTPTNTPIPTKQYIAPTVAQTPIVQQQTSTSNITNQGNPTVGSSTTSVPAGATALCNDGSYSFAEHHQGACSQHGGVKEFYN